MAAPVYYIKLKTGNSNGTIDMSDNGHTKAKKTGYIFWEIMKHSGIGSITNIYIKPGNPDIFLIHPHFNGTDWEAEVSPGATTGSICNYAIDWKDTNGNQMPTFDPKIEVLPTDKDFDNWIIGLIIAAFGVLTLTFFQKNIFRKAKKHK